MAQNFDLSRTADELTTYAAERQVGFEQHRLGNSFHHPGARNEWVRDILRGMAEVNGADGGELTARFDRQLEEAHGCFGVEMLSQAGQKHAVQALRGTPPRWSSWTATSADGSCGYGTCCKTWPLICRGTPGPLGSIPPGSK